MSFRAEMYGPAWFDTRRFAPLLTMKIWFVRD
jgi:hypothetical protein